MVSGVGMVTVPVKVGEASGAKAVLVKALVPSVPPVPILRVEVSVPARVRVLDIVNVLEVVPPAMVKPVVAAARVSAFTEVGVIAPKVRVIAGVVVGVATEPETPLAVTTDALVTVPAVGVVQVGAKVVPAEVKTCPTVPLAKSAVVSNAD